MKQIPEPIRDGGESVQKTGQGNADRAENAAASMEYQKQERDRIDIFEHSLNFPKVSSDRPINKIVLSAALIAILGIAAIYLSLRPEPSERAF